MFSFLTTDVLKKLFKSSILKNYFFMSIYQAINFVIPLVIIPFVIKKVGFSNFGLTVFSYSFVNYFLVLTDYGFNLSATREISICRDNTSEVNKIFNKVLTCKIFLLLICFLLFVAIVLVVPIFREQFTLHLLGFTVVVAQCFLPLWLFQGLEEMKFIAILNSFSKMLSMIFMFLFIRHESDFIYVNLFFGLGGILACIIGFIFIFRKYGLRFTIIPIAEVYKELKAGYALFLSSFSVNIYVNSNAFILGLLVTPVALAYYSVAEKVLFALKQLTSVFSQVIYPHVCLLADQSLDKVIGFFKKAMLPFLFCIVLVCISVWVMSPEIVFYFLKKHNSEAVSLIRWLSIVPFIVALDVPAFQTLLAYNKRKEYSFVLGSACVFSIVINFILASIMGAQGTVISIIITETYVTLYLSYIVYKRIILKPQNG